MCRFVTVLSILPLGTAFHSDVISRASVVPVHCVGRRPERVTDLNVLCQPKICQLLSNNCLIRHLPQMLHFGLNLNREFRKIQFWGLGERRVSHAIQKPDCCHGRRYVRQIPHSYTWTSLIWMSCDMWFNALLFCFAEQARRALLNLFLTLV